MNIQKSIIKISVISCLIPIFFLGIYSFVLTRSETEKREQEKIELLFNSERQQLELITEKMESILDLLDFFVIHSKENNSKNHRFEVLVKEVMADIVVNNKEVENIFFGSKSGEFFMQGSGFVPKEYDPRSRPWYKGAIEKKGDYYITDVYNFPNKERGITIAKIVDFQGKIIGVVGVDISFSNYQLKTSLMSIGKTGKIFIIDQHGELVVDTSQKGDNKTNITLIKEYMALNFNVESSYLDTMMKLENPIIFDIETPYGEKYFRVEPILKLGLIMVGGTYKDELKELPLSVVKVGIIVSLVGILISLLIISLFSKKLNAYLKKLSILIEGISSENYNKNIKEISMYIHGDSELDIITKKVRKIQKTVNKREVILKEKAIKDSLIGLYNRESLGSFLEDQIIKNKVFQSKFSIIMIDLDDFKNINDLYGHVCGDLVLKGISKIFLEQTSRMDKVFRYGGEEFIIILPEANKNEAFKVGERLREKVEKQEFEYNEKKIKLTISGGVTEYRKGFSGKELIELVDKLLYRSKKTGKNKILY